MRLSRKTIDRLPRTVKRPHYDLRTVTVGIVHLGIGAFHRAHQAVYTDGLLSEDPSWGICGISLRSPETRDALQPQDGLYTLAVRTAKAPISAWSAVSSSSFARRRTRKPSFAAWRIPAHGSCR